jgi:hypothetical protein
MAYTTMATQRSFSLPYRSINNPANGEVMAINNAGSVNASLTRKLEFSIPEKAIDISGKEGEMVTIDITVRVLTSSTVSFSAGLVFMVLR